MNGEIKKAISANALLSLLEPSEQSIIGAKATAIHLGAWLVLAVGGGVLMGQVF